MTDDEPEPMWDYWFIADERERIYQRYIPFETSGLDTETATTIRDELSEVIEWLEEKHDESER